MLDYCRRTIERQIMPDTAFIQLREQLEHFGSAALCLGKERHEIEATLRFVKIVENKDAPAVIGFLRRSSRILNRSPQGGCVYDCVMANCSEEIKRLVIQARNKDEQGERDENIRVPL